MTNMANLTKKFDWGFLVIDFHGFKYAKGSNYKQQIHTSGTIVIKPKGIIPLHIRFDDWEQYQALTWGVHPLVLSADELMKMTSDEILRQVAKAPEMKINQVSTCKQGQAHIVYNSSDVAAKLRFTRFFSDID